MKKTAIIAVVLILGSIGRICAQDTIDTTYYRYDHHFMLSQGPLASCPNGWGFRWMYNNSDIFANSSCNEYLSLYPNYNGGPDERNYMMYMFGEEQVRRTIYGIGICLDSIADFTNGDTLVVTVCKASDNRTHMIHLDSMFIKGGERGKRRWMEIPIHEDRYEFYDYDTTFDNCICDTLYRQVLEIYFDTPIEAGNVPYIFFRARKSNEHGSRFLFSDCNPDIQGMMGYSDYELRLGTAIAGRWTYFFPILTPLPEWEEASVEQVIPWPAGVDIPDPDNPGDPDNPQDPDDPDDPDNPGDPDNPQDPDNPDDPDNPSDPDNPQDPSDNEGIGMIDGMYGISIAPNPTDGLTTVSSTTPIVELSVCDMAGRRILHETSCGAVVAIDTTPLRKGIYLVQVRTTNATKTGKLVVK